MDVELDFLILESNNKNNYLCSEFNGKGSQVSLH